MIENYTMESLNNLSRKDLQNIAKAHGYRANLKSSKLIELLFCKLINVDENMVGNKISQSQEYNSEKENTLEIASADHQVESTYEDNRGNALNSICPGIEIMVKYEGKWTKACINKVLKKSVKVKILFCEVVIKVKLTDIQKIAEIQSFVDIEQNNDYFNKEPIPISEFFLKSEHSEPLSLESKDENLPKKILLNEYDSVVQAQCMSSAPAVPDQENEPIEQNDFSVSSINVFGDIMELEDLADRDDDDDLEGNHLDGGSQNTFPEKADHINSIESIVPLIEISSECSSSDQISSPCIPAATTLSLPDENITVCMSQSEGVDKEEAFAPPGSSPQPQLQETLPSAQLQRKPAKSQQIRPQHPDWKRSRTETPIKITPIKAPSLSSSKHTPSSILRRTQPQFLPSTPSHSIPGNKNNCRTIESKSVKIVMAPNFDKIHSRQFESMKSITSCTRKVPAPQPHSGPQNTSASSSQEWRISTKFASCLSPRARHNVAFGDPDLSSRKSLNQSRGRAGLKTPETAPETAAYFKARAMSESFCNRSVSRCVSRPMGPTNKNKENGQSKNAATGLVLVRSDFAIHKPSQTATTLMATSSVKKRRAEFLQLCKQRQGAALSTVRNRDNGSFSN